MKPMKKEAGPGRGRQGRNGRVAEGLYIMQKPWVQFPAEGGGGCDRGKRETRRKKKKRRTQEPPEDEM